MIKRILVALVLFLLPVNAFAGEVIENFHTNIALEPSGRMVVTEFIDYYFDEPRHGIYRDIPIMGEIGNEIYKLEILVSEVADEEGNPRPYTIGTNSSTLRIKVGSEFTTITGLERYVIKYMVRKVVLAESLEDQPYEVLLWNITGDDWEVDINQSSHTVTLPVSTSETIANCYKGYSGSTQSCDDTKFDYADERVVHFNTGYIPSGSGATIEIFMPAGTIAQLLQSVEKDWIQMIPWWLIPLLMLAIMIVHWVNYGRDPKHPGSVVTQFEPPEGMGPGLVGVLYDEHVHGRDVVAEIVNLAKSGYLKIVREPKEGALGKLFSLKEFKLVKKPKPINNSEVKRKLMWYLFKGKDEVKLSEIKSRKYEDLEGIHQYLYAKLVRGGYYVENPKKVRAKYAAAGALLIWTPIFLARYGFSGMEMYTEQFLGLVISGPIVVAFSFLMPKRTKKGARIQHYLEGFKKYLDKAEKERLHFHNDPQKNLEHFENILPYAIALDVDDKWARAFANVSMAAPIWYADYSGGSFNPESFTSTFSDIKVSAPAPRGGGGSGGGFGGGGGGSW